MLASSSSPPSTPASATGDDEFELDNRQRNDSADASPTFSPLIFRNKRRLNHLTLKAEGTLASLALKTPFKPAETTKLPNAFLNNNNSKRNRPPLVRSSTLPVMLAQPTTSTSSYRFAVPHLPNGNQGVADGPAFKIRRTSMDIGDDGEAQRIRNTAIAPPTTDCEVARNTPSAPPLPLCSQSFSISGERLSIPHQASGKDAVKRITPKTLSELLDGNYNQSLDEFYIVDCRFSYEYEGGHIRDALNFNTHDQLLARFFPNGLENHQTDCNRRLAIIFHCEFSSHRGPRMALFLRSQDRIANGANYPNLHYPEIYILEGGYREFFKDFKQHCEPQAYIEMKDRNFKDDLKSEKMKRGGSYMRQNTASSFNIGSAPDDSNRRLQRSRTAFCLSDGMAIGSGGHRTISPIFAELALRKESGGGGEELFQSASFNFSPPKISGKDLSVPLEDALSFMSTPAKDLPKPIPRAPADPLATRRPNIFDLINGGTAAAKESNNQNVADNRMPQWGKSGKSGHAAVRSWSQRF